MRQLENLQIGMYTGQRLEDCVLMQWQNIDLEQKRIWTKTIQDRKRSADSDCGTTTAHSLENTEVAGRFLCLSEEVAARYQIENESGKKIGESLS